MSAENEWLYEPKSCLSGIEDSVAICRNSEGWGPFDVLVFCIFHCLNEVNNKFCRPSIFLAFSPLSFFLSFPPFLSFLFSCDLLCCPQMKQRGRVTSCSSTVNCKLGARAGQLQGTHGGRGGSEVHLLLCDMVTDSVVARESSINAGCYWEWLWWGSWNAWVVFW